MGIMAGGPFSLCGQQTGGTGVLLYPFPTGEAAEAPKKEKENKMENSSVESNADKSHKGQAEPQTNQNY